MADVGENWPQRHPLDAEGWGGAPPSPRSPGISGQSLNLVLTQEPSKRSGGEVDAREEGFCSCGNAVAAGIVLLGLGFVASCVVALALQHPIAAGLAAVGAWLSWQAFVLHRDCRGIRAKLQASLEVPASGSGGMAPGAPNGLTVPTDGRSDLDLTGYARNLGIAVPAVGMQAPPGQPGYTMEAVMLSALVNEYLRCVETLKQYQTSYGHLPDAPPADPAFAVAEALMVGLGLGGAPAGAAPASQNLMFPGLGPTPGLGPPRTFDFQLGSGPWDKTAEEAPKGGSRSPSPMRSVTFGDFDGGERRGRSPPKEWRPVADGADPVTGQGARARSTSQPAEGSPRADHDSPTRSLPEQERTAPISTARGYTAEAPPLRFNKPAAEEEKPTWLKPRPRLEASPAPAPLVTAVDRPSWLPPRRG